MVVYLLFLPFIFIYLQTATIFGKNKPNLILIPTYICIFFFHSLHCDISYIKIFKFEFMWKSFTKTLIAENVLWYGCIFFIYRGVGTGEAGEVKQLLHRKSESESAKILANWQIYPVFILAASPEILLFLPPVYILIS